MTEYPYGRNGEVVCYYESKVTEDELRLSGDIGDNEVYFDGDTVYLYEAPMEDDPGRGHYSVWVPSESGQYKQEDSISGDDGMCYERFKEHT